MNKKIKKWSLGILSACIILLAISVLIALFSSQTFFSSLRLVFGSIYVLFLPGLIISYLFFPNTKDFDSESENKDSIDWIERGALSFALSIAIVPLAVFYLNLVGLKINVLNSTITILVIILLSGAILFWKKNKRF